MTRWEYHTLIVKGVREGKMDKLLNELGAQGWELASVFAKSGNLGGGLTRGVFVFKRPVVSSPPPAENRR